MEVLVILAVAAVVGVVWVYAWVQSWHLARGHPREDIERMQRRAAWLQQRLDCARAENWDAAMVDPIAEELQATAGELAARTETG